MKRELKIEKARERIEKNPAQIRQDQQLKRNYGSTPFLNRPKSLDRSVVEPNSKIGKVITHQPDAASPKNPQRDSQAKEEEMISKWNLERSQNEQNIQAAGARKPIKSALKSKPSIPAEPSALEQLQQLRRSDLVAQRQKREQITEKPTQMKFV